MRLSDFEKAERLVTARERIINARERLDEVIAEYADERPDCGGVDATLDVGYSFHISSHKDGSGLPVDFAGCYIAIDACKAIAKVLQDKLIKVDAALLEIGVDPE